METTTPFPPPVSPHEEVENDNRLQPIAGSPLQVLIASPALPVDDVAHNQEQFMDSISPSLMTSTEKSVDHRQPPPLGDGDVELENENRQPEIVGSSSQVFFQSPMKLIEEVEYHHNQQLLNSISSNILPLPENLVDRQISPPQEDGEDQQEPAVLCSPPPLEEKIRDCEEPFSPPSPVSLLPPSLPSTDAEHPSEYLGCNRESPPPSQSPSLSPSLSSSSPPTEAEYPPENLSIYQESPQEHLNSNHEFPLSKQQPSLSPPPGYSPENVSPPENVGSNHESQLSKQPSSPSPSPETDYPSTNLVPSHESPPENNSPTNESPLSKQPPSPSLSPSPPPTEAECLPENLGPNHESPLSKQPQSPSISLSPPAAEADYPPENFSPNHESLAEDFSPNLVIPLSKQPPSPLSSLPPIEAESPPGNLSLNHESTLSKPPPSPSLTGPEEPTESPDYHINRNSDHESPSSSVELQGNPNPSPKLKQSPKDLSPSPQHDILEPNTRTPPPGVPLLLHAAATFTPSKPQISPWTHQETANLIQAYQEKWYSLRKGPLKASQWEEVAITVAARCSYDEPTKTSKQCRHKIEKLRKRYRTERGKPRSKANAWNFFKLMDNLEKGPLLISSSQPMELVEYQKPSTSNGKKRKTNVYEDDGDREFLVANKRSSRVGSSNHHVTNGGLARNLRFSDNGNRVVRGLRTLVIHKRKGVYQDESEEENNENVCEEDDVATQLAAEIKGFAKKFVKMEKSKIETMRDVERYRLEMENKRMEMIIESQQMLVETVNNAFGSSVKTHRLSAS